MLGELIYGLPGLLTAIVLHELAHALTAVLLGDPTPRNQGRLTLNPLKHIDPVGMLMLFVFKFGWAKPVQVEPRYFKDPRRGMMLVSLAGPLTNFLTAYVAIALMKILEPRPDDFFNPILSIMIIYNVSLGVFNLIPVPPLDGSKVLAALLPYRQGNWLYAMETYGWIILILLLSTGILGRILRPMVNFMLMVLDRSSFFLDRAVMGVPGGFF